MIEKMFNIALEHNDIWCYVIWLARYTYGLALQLIYPLIRCY